jgi:general secretion pathway protein B
MSFILDALKKSESDRERQGGPALFEVKVAPPRSALPPWAVAIAVLFLLNLALVGWLVLRHAPAAPGSVPAAAAPAAPASPPPSSPASASPAPASAALPATATASPGAAPGSAVMSAPAPQPAAGPSLTRNGPAQPLRDAAEELPPPGPAGAGAREEDYAPATEAPPQGGLGRVRRGTDAGVPLYQQLATTPTSHLPQLRLDLHAYAERAEDRWVLINMHKLHEGESLEGVRVEHITPEGAVLSWQGSQFLLTQE